MTKRKPGYNIDMNLISENIINTIFIVITLSISFLYFSALMRIRHLNKLLIDTFFQNLALTQIYENNKEADNDFHKESFIKFLSDSRDWAFDYIESSQTTIQEVIDNLDKVKQKDLYEKLKKLLPEATDDRR